MTTAQTIANRPDAYGARYNRLGDARAARIRLGGRYRIILGCDGTFWVMRGRYAKALAAAGYELTY